MQKLMYSQVAAIFGGDFADELRRAPKKKKGGPALKRSPIPAEDFAAAKAIFGPAVASKMFYAGSRPVAGAGSDGLSIHDRLYHVPVSEIRRRRKNDARRTAADQRQRRKRVERTQALGGMFHLD